MPRDLTAAEARAILKTSDLRGLRKRAGIRAATIGLALDVTPQAIHNWERRKCLPQGWLLVAYARVIAGLARHEQIDSDDEEAPCAA